MPTWLKQNRVGAWTKKKEKSDAAQTSLVAWVKNTSLRDPGASRNWHLQCEGSALLAGPTQATCLRPLILSQRPGSGNRLRALASKHLKNRHKQVEKRLLSHGSAPSMWKASSRHWQHSFHKHGQLPNTWSTIMAQCWSSLLNRCQPTKMPIASPGHGQSNLHKHSQPSNTWGTIMV